MALKNDGSVISWGRNKGGQLGSGNNTGSIYPVDVVINGGASLSQIMEISAGYSHSLALNSLGEVFAWGRNDNGELGTGNTASLNYAKPITGLTNIQGISAGKNHSVCFSGNDIYTWGNNSFNQLGLSAGGIATSSLIPISAVVPIGMSDISKIECGDFHNLALTKDSKLYAWGDDQYLQLAVLPINFSGNTPPFTSPIIELNSTNNALTLETPLVKCDNEINYCTYDYAVSGAEVWSSGTTPSCYLTDFVLIENELFVPRGESLTINSGVTVMFGPKGRIVLEEGDGTDDGAQLILNSGSTLTAAGDCMWKGIEVRGTSSFNSADSRQGKVIVNSGAVIEHAHNAITLGRWDDGYYACFESQPIVHLSGFDLTGSGGQIECDDATFQNNAIDIRFAAYPHLSSSTIENSTFEGGILRDPRYLSSTSNIFYAAFNSLQRSSNAIRQLESKIVRIEGNDFRDYEEALKLTDSRLNVIGNSFEDCLIGINTNSTFSVLIYGGQIEGNTFKNVRTQIKASGGRYLNIFGGNNFNSILPAGNQIANLRGVYLNNETAFSIFDNNFTSLKYAIVALNSSNPGGVIGYNDPLLGGNLFTDCWRSIQLQGNNGNLKIKCNSFNNDAGGSIYNTNWFLNTGGLLANQGLPSLTDQTTQSGNWFVQSPLLNQISSVSISPFTYFRHGAGSPNEVIPASNGTGVINIDVTSIAMSTFDEACDPIVIPTNGEPDRLAYYENVIDSLNLEMDTLIGSIDNQFTDSLVAIIDNFYPQDTILDRLRSNGTLSDTVLIKAINTVDALNDTALYEVLFVNSPFSNEVLIALNNRYPEMDEGLRESLNSVQGVNPPFVTITGLIKEMDYCKVDKRLIINSYVTRLSSQDSVDKAIQVLEAENSYEDRQTVFGTYITLGELDSAATKLELLINSGIAETDWLTLSEILLSLTADGKTWFDMTDGEADMLREIALQEENTLAKVQSQNVLHLVFGDTFPVIIDDEEIYLRQMQKPQEDTKIFINNENLQLYPNPANENVEIKLNNNKELISQVDLLNNLGNIVLNKNIGEKQSTYQLNTSQLPSGLYLIKVTVTSGITYSNKLMIVK